MKSQWARMGLVSRVGLVGLVGFAAACAPTAGTTPKAGTSMSASIIEPYLKIHDALADDQVDGIKAAAGQIATAATSLGAPAMKVDTTALQLSAAAEAEPADLKDVREKFGALSDALVTYMQGEKLRAPDGVRTAFCPMAQKPWLQKGDTISNPYYGKEMPTCGDFR
jgi:HPt (histidine-containing phosphotransfer) domain-containing protein